MSSSEDADVRPRDPIALPPLCWTPSEDGVQVATYDFGGSGADVLLVHATGFCAGVWTPVASQLGSTRRVAALDVRGHGRSAPAEVGMAWSGTAADVLAVVDELGLTRPVGVGHSMGGASLLLAEQRRPGTFAGLWLYEPIVFPPGVAGPATGSNPLAEGARRRRDRFDSAAAAIENYSSKPPFSALAPAALAAYVRDGFEHLEDGTVRLRCRPEIEAQTYEMGGRHDAFAHLGEVRCPVVVARGSADVPGPAGLVEQIVAQLPNARIEEHPNLGHFGPLEDPERIAASIDRAVRATS